MTMAEDCINRIDHKISKTIEKIEQELNNERTEEDALYSMEQIIESMRRRIIDSRERTSQLERKATLLHALKVVEELPQGSLAERRTRLTELLAAKGINSTYVHPIHLSQILEGDIGHAYHQVFLMRSGMSES